MIDVLRDLWFQHCSRAPVARLLRAERRRLDIELARRLPCASAAVRRQLLAAIGDAESA
ncbi:hypothetical protein AB0F71_17820 [Kitasatospora sp. NPDC028055]|uniref:hypothetical protein n=1 Tax=Kitasatospora sp. NPDC028055 TaxID=3155653 RepID=UPI0033FDEB8C